MWQGLHHGVNFLEVKLIWEVCVAWKRSDVVLERYRTMRTTAARSSGCAAIDPQLELLAAAFTCGQLVVLTFPEGAEKHRSNLWPKAVSGSDNLRLAWQPNGTDPREDTLTSVWVKQLLY